LIDEKSSAGGIRAPAECLLSDNDEILENRQHITAIRATMPAMSSKTKTTVQESASPTVPAQYDVERHAANDVVLEDQSQLVEYLASGCKSRPEWRLGAEQEQFAYVGEPLRPAHYETGIRVLLESMRDAGWWPVEENGLPIALTRGGASITLEPGGQVEYSSAPFISVHDIDQETATYLQELRHAAGDCGLKFLAMGHQPLHPRSDISWMPKRRYQIMQEWMPRQGNGGLDMMQSTAAMQMTVDFSDEPDMVRKFRVALALQPIAEALFANSPYSLGRKTGSVSHRSKIWSETDPQRCGTLPFVFEDGMGFERYAEYVLDVPMYFVHRNDQYIDASGCSFRDFLVGELSVLPGEKPRVSDWVNHLTTVFPQVRMKTFLELRGADAGDAQRRMPALCALWAGILYHDESLAEACERVTNWSADDFAALQDAARLGFRTPFRDETVRELAAWMLHLSRNGLRHRNFQNDQGEDESRFLTPLDEAVESGRTFAEQLVDRVQSEWNGDVAAALPHLCEETWQ